MRSNWITVVGIGSCSIARQLRKWSEEHHGVLRAAEKGEVPKAPIYEIHVDLSKIPLVEQTAVFSRIDHAVPPEGILKVDMIRGGMRPDLRTLGTFLPEGGNR